MGVVNECQSWYLILGIKTFKRKIYALMHCVQLGCKYNVQLCIAFTCTCMFGCTCTYTVWISVKPIQYSLMHVYMYIHVWTYIIIHSCIALHSHVHVCLDVHILCGLE